MDVKHVAKLANLPLTAEEEEKYLQQLSQILEYVDQIDSIDTSNIEPTFNVSGQENIIREDKIGPCLPQDEAISNGSNIKDSSFVTKGVFDNE